MKNFNESGLQSYQDKLAALEEKLERLAAYCDQKFDEIAGTIDDLDSRINNLR
jgi:hypothetical protein